MDESPRRQARPLLTSTEPSGSSCTDSRKIPPRQRSSQSWWQRPPGQLSRWGTPRSLPCSRTGRRQGTQRGGRMSHHHREVPCLWSAEQRGWGEGGGGGGTERGGKSDEEWMEQRQRPSEWWYQPRCAVKVQFSPGTARLAVHENRTNSTCSTEPLSQL